MLKLVYYLKCGYTENADTIYKMLKLHGPSMICLWFVVFIVDLCLTTSTSLYFIHQNDQVNKDTSYRNVADIVTSIYRVLVIGLCIRFMAELLQGSITEEQTEHLSDEYHRLKKRSATNYSWYKKATYFFKGLELNQFTIAPLLAATYELYCSALLFIAVYNGASKWYIMTAFTYFLGAFSMPIPGICFNQFITYKKLQEKKEKNLIYEIDDG